MLRRREKQIESMKSATNEKKIEYETRLRYTEYNIERHMRHFGGDCITDKKRTQFMRDLRKVERKIIYLAK